MRGAGRIDIAICHLVAIWQYQFEVALCQSCSGKAVKNGDAQPVKQADFGRGGSWNPRYFRSQFLRHSYTSIQAVLMEAVATPGSSKVQASLTLSSYVGGEGCKS